MERVERSVGWSLVTSGHWPHHQVTQAARHLSDLNRVADQGASFELTRGGRRIARLVPAGPSKRFKISELNDIFARIPKLGDEADAFERDIADAQSVLVPDRDPWED